MIRIFQRRIILPWLVLDNVGLRSLDLGLAEHGRIDVHELDQRELFAQEVTVLARIVWVQESLARDMLSSIFQLAVILRKCRRISSIAFVEACGQQN